MTATVRLRRWQKQALDQLTNHDGRNFLAVATPGAGKTTFALTAARVSLAERPTRRVVVVAPTQHLRLQWAEAAHKLGLELEPGWSASRGVFPRDAHGVVVTYQQVATSAVELRRCSEDAFVILDEIHHAGNERTWGDAIAVAFDEAARRLALSGTPFRSDTNPIPFVSYRDEEASSDFTYGYNHALRDGVVRSVTFPRLDGHMEWVGADGTNHSHTFGDLLDRSRAGQRLRTALSLGGEWLPTVLRRAHEQLLIEREHQPNAGGLVIAIDQEHARGIAAMMRRILNVDAVVAVSDDPDASGTIAKFAASRVPWIVAVRMVSEGVDVPRLRVGVFATNTTTELFFRQAVGRLVRRAPGEADRSAHMFIPDDMRLRTYAAEIARERTHILRRRDDDGERFVETDPWMLAQRERAIVEPLEQGSLFTAISAVALDEEHTTVAANATVADDASLVLQLGELPAPVGTQVAAEDSPIADVPRHRRRTVLRTRNRDAVLDLVQRTGLTHARVNSQLNQAAGITRINDATIEQLEARLREAQKWRRNATKSKR